MGMNEEESNQYERLQDLKKRLEKPSQSKVVLVGDVMLDRYIHGYANDLNSRAPVPVLKETNRYDDVGAAAHVARGLESLGLHALLHGVIGKDSAGKIILDSLNEEGVDCKHIKSVENKVTTVKNRLIASRPSLLHNEQLLLRWDIENREDICRHNVISKRKCCYFRNQIVFFQNLKLACLVSLSTFCDSEYKIKQKKRTAS